jgi:hypothetical protein
MLWQGTAGGTASCLSHVADQQDKHGEQCAVAGLNSSLMPSSDAGLPVYLMVAGGQASQQ